MREVARRAGDSDAELTKAVDFATLISMSSLSTPDVQDDRLTGRKEITARLAEQAEVFGLVTDSSATGAGYLDPVFECRVADQLELLSHTFEAELRYRRLQACPAVAHRLALMLDAKGFHQESWQWYVRAARSNDVNSLFRLATICWQRGSRGWAMRLAKHAVAQLDPVAYDNLVRNIDDLVRQRTAAPRVGKRLLARSVLHSKTGTDTVYALGSVLLVLASRPDLARLAYFSGLVRGHSLAAVSLLELTRSPPAEQPGSWRLSNLLRDGLGDGEFQKYLPVGDQRDDFDRSLLLLENGVQNETFEGLGQAIRAAGVEVSTDRREDAVERVLFTTRLITSLRGYGQFGYDMKALRDIDQTADIVCGKVRRELVTGAVGDTVSLINIIRGRSAQELNSCRQSEPKHPGSQCEKKANTERRRKNVAVSGTVGRLWRKYSTLPSEHREVLILRLVGLYSDEVAEALGYRKGDADRLFMDAVTRLREAQRGEQVPTAKLLGAEVDSCFSADVVELIAPPTAWSDAGDGGDRGATSQPDEDVDCGEPEHWWR